MKNPIEYKIITEEKAYTNKNVIHVFQFVYDLTNSIRAGSLQELKEYTESYMKLSKKYYDIN